MDREIIRTEEKGNLGWIDKNVLLIDKTYQRTAIKSNIEKISKDWSWVSCGVITVAKRDSLYYVIDGQHRVMASRTIKDIKSLPCLVFDTDNLKEEAMGFVSSNTSRKNMNSIDKYNAMIIGEDPTAILVSKLLYKYKINAVKAVEHNRDTSSIAWIIKHANKNINDLDLVLSLVSELCSETTIKVKILEALMYFQKHVKQGLGDTKIHNRMLSLGVHKILSEITRNISIMGRGSDDVCGNAILQAYNKGLRNKIEYTIQGRK